MKRRDLAGLAASLGLAGLPARRARAQSRAESLRVLTEGATNSFDPIGLGDAFSLHVDQRRATRHVAAQAPGRLIRRDAPAANRRHASLTAVITPFLSRTEMCEARESIIA